MSSSPSPLVQFPRSMSNQHHCCSLCLLYPRPPVSLGAASAYAQQRHNSNCAPATAQHHLGLRTRHLDLSHRCYPLQMHSIQSVCKVHHCRSCVRTSCCFITASLAHMSGAIQHPLAPAGMTLAACAPPCSTRSDRVELTTTAMLTRISLLAVNCLPHDAWLESTCCTWKQRSWLQMPLQCSVGDTTSWRQHAGDCSSTTAS